MEPRLGHDFSNVRVHTDAKAAESAVAVNALAYTAGRDMVFAAGQYAPASIAGKKVLAHELTHVVQQRKGGIAPLHRAGATIVRDDAYEREADAQSALVTEAERAHGGSHQSAPVSRGTTPALAIQLLETPTTSPARAGGSANVAQEAQGNSDSAATDDQGKICIRFYLPGVTGGKVSWEGISQETLDKHVRLKSEDYRLLFKATADSTDTCDAVYFGAAQNRFILKIPDHCTVTFRNSFTNSSCCCNSFGSWLAEQNGRAVAPRPGTAVEFGVPNNWEAAKASGAEPVKQPNEPNQPKGIPIPIKG